MNKIPTLYLRDEEDRRYVTGMVTPGCEWVIAGEGVPTRKYDGTCVMHDGRDWWARREVRPGKPIPMDYQYVSTDEVTGKVMGWEPIEQSPFAKYAREAIAQATFINWEPGTYELFGPKVNGNPERAGRHLLVRHEDAIVLDTTMTVPELIGYCMENGYEGVVWHHPDGRMAKLKVRDFKWERV